MPMLLKIKPRLGIFLTLTLCSIWIKTNSKLVFRYLCVTLWTESDEGEREVDFLPHSHALSAHFRPQQLNNKRYPPPSSSQERCNNNKKKKNRQNIPSIISVQEINLYKTHTTPLFFEYINIVI